MVQLRSPGDVALCLCAHNEELEALQQRRDFIFSFSASAGSMGLSVEGGTRWDVDCYPCGGCAGLRSGCF